MKHLTQKLPLLLLIAMAVMLLFVACTGDSQPTDDTTADTVWGTEADTLIEIDTTTADTLSETTSQTEAEEGTVAVVEPDISKSPDMAISGDGYNIYTRVEDVDWGYRYGCTYLYAEDAIHAYFAAVGSGGEWDWITYKKSTDGGATWTDEKVVLTPTQGSMDFYSNCDPGVVYFGGYYYLGYTSTLNSQGACNNLFVARSKNPDGPFEKWNGNGWGGYECQPIVYYDQNYEKFGIGEPAFIELNGTLYIYYTMSAPTGDYTMVATADVTNENWPATMKFHGVATQRMTDSLDVKYVEDWGKFIAVSTGDRMGAASWLALYESNDGLHFTLVDAVRENTYSHLHNAGISSRPNGHINLAEDADQLRVIYAYGEGWGTWNTRVQPIALQLTDNKDVEARITQEKQKACLPDPGDRAPAVATGDRFLVMVRTEQDVYEYPVRKTAFSFNVNVVDQYMEYHELNRREEGVTFSGYDESIISIGKNNKVTIKGVGMTPVIVSYQGLSNVFWVNITETQENNGSADTPVSFEPVKDTYYIYYGERNLYRPQVRGRMWWADGSFTEFLVDETDEQVTFSGYDESIISVSYTGMVSALKKGETEVTMTCREMSIKVKIVVTDDKSLGCYQMQKEQVVMDYANLDFTVEEALGVMTNLHHTSAEHTEDAILLSVTGTESHDNNDPQFTISFEKSLTPVNADAYDFLEITYKVPTTVSQYANQLQIFFMVGDVTQAGDAVKVGAHTMQNLIVDGEYHILRIDLSGKAWWTGNINALRIDFFNYAEQGDSMYITNIKLVSAEEKVEIDYTDFDFTKEAALGVMSDVRGTAIHAENATLLTVTGTDDWEHNDPQFAIYYNESPVAVNADDYDYLEITYKVPTTVSEHANQLQIFFVVGDITKPEDAVAAGAHTMQNLIVDGEYHTLRIDLSDKAWWTGNINFFRIDYLNYALPGDCIYLTNIKLGK